LVLFSAEQAPAGLDGKLWVTVRMALPGWKDQWRERDQSAVPRTCKPPESRSGKRAVSVGEHVLRKLVMNPDEINEPGYILGRPCCDVVQETEAKKF